jgi:hypothetical protein
MVTATAFDTAAFDAAARQLRMFADGYAEMGMDAATAASWANMGYTPNEARPHIEAGRNAEQANAWDARPAWQQGIKPYRKSCTCC